MGTRLRKIIGYGFVDVIEKDARFTNDVADTFSMADYRKWCTENVEENLRDTSIYWDDVEDFRTSEILTYQEPEEDYLQMDNDHGFFILSPVGLRDEARRSDDNMDYADFQHYHPELAEQMIGTSYETYAHPFPYSPHVIDVNTKQFIHNDEVTRYLRNGKILSKYSSERMLLARTPYTSVTELDASAKLVPPAVIKYLTEYLNVFTDPNSWEDMKPYVVTYFA